MENSNSWSKWIISPLPTLRDQATVCHYNKEFTAQRRPHSAETYTRWFSQPTRPKAWSTNQSANQYTVHMFFPETRRNLLDKSQPCVTSVSSNKNSNYFVYMPSQITFFFFSLPPSPQTTSCLKILISFWGLSDGKENIVINILA